MEETGVTPSDAMTALRGLDDILRLKRGESLMVFGAGGGIGHLAVQPAKRIEARVFAVASGDDGVALARRLGADAVANGRKDDVEGAIGRRAGVSSRGLRFGFGSSPSPPPRAIAPLAMGDRRSPIGYCHPRGRSRPTIADDQRQPTLLLRPVHRLA